MSFQKDFVWGVATAAYQIEGAAMRTAKDYRTGICFAVKKAISGTVNPATSPATIIIVIRKTSIS